MRSLLVDSHPAALFAVFFGSAAAAALLGAAPLRLAAVSDATPAPNQKAPAPDAAVAALHAGDAITDRQLFSYLSYPAHAGDWFRYRVSFAGKSTVVKTIGFGIETVSGAGTLFIESDVHAIAVTGLPPSSTMGIGTDAVLKTYIAGDTFSDFARPYRVIANALRVGNLEYEIKPGQNQTFSLLTGALGALPRSGRVRSVDALDVHVSGKTLHATRIVARFEGANLPAGGFATPFTLEVVQSPDLPLGTVSISNSDPQGVRWRLVAFGNGYRSAFSKTLDEIRSAAAPST